MIPNADSKAEQACSGSHRYGTVESTSATIPSDSSGVCVVLFEYVIDCIATTSCLSTVGAKVNEILLGVNLDES